MGLRRSTLTTFNFDVTALEGCTLPWFPGHETRGGFLNALRSVDEGLANTLHSGVEGGVRGRRSVMSLKALRLTSGVKWVRVEGGGPPPIKSGLGARLGFKALVEPGATGWFSVTILDEGVARDAVMTIPSLMGAEVTVGPCRLKVSSLRIEVIDVARLLGEAPEDWVGTDIYFHTPTYLNPLRGDARYKILYPELTALLGNLIATARHVTREDYPKPEDLASNAYVSGIDIKTPRTRSGNTAPTGFIGWVKIRPKDDAAPKARKLITYLLKLAEKTNIGGNRSAGYGEVTVRIERAGQGSNNQRTPSQA